MAPAPLLSLQGAVRCFPAADGTGVLRVLDGVSLDVAAGQSHAVLGRSGSGKSTLLAVLGLLDRPDRGSYHVGGIDTAHLTDRELAALRGQWFGFVFQRFFLLPHLTARQNVELALIHGSPLRKAARLRAADQALQRVGLADRRHHRPAQLSGGEQQRVAIARAVAQVPKVVLADEPTGALDERTAEDTVSWLLDLCHDQGSALVVVTHDRQVADRMATSTHLVAGRWAS